MDAYQVRTWQGWHHHMALTLIAVWFLIGETHRGQQWTPALTLPHVRDGLSVLLLEVCCTPGTATICLTFRTLFRTFQAILEEPPAASGAGANYRLLHAL